MSLYSLPAQGRLVSLRAESLYLSSALESPESADSPPYTYLAVCQVPETPQSRHRPEGPLSRWEDVKEGGDS